MGIRFVDLRARALIAVALALGLVALVAGCGSGDSDSSSGGTDTGSAETTASGGGGESALAGCGKGTKPASGTPIKLGAIVTDIPGADLTPVTNSVKAYFDCVNEHGGIGGRPIEYLVEGEQLNPQQTSALASKLINDENVMGMVGNTSLIDCSVNGSTYAQAGINIVGGAVDAACYELPSFAPANLGPTYSAQLAAQYLVESESVDSLLALTTQVPGFEALNAGVIGVGEAAGLETAETPVAVPITDPNGTALSAANQAGESGGVVLDLAPEEMAKLLSAVEKQGLVERTHWGCLSTCTNSGLVEVLGPAWDGKLIIANDFPALDADSPDETLYREVNEQYNGSEELSPFGQLGFVMGKIYADTLAELPESQLNREGINAAVAAIEGYETDMLCEPFSFGKGKYHVPVTAGRLFTVEGGELTEIQGCSELEAVTPAMKGAQAG